MEKSYATFLLQFKVWKANCVCKKNPDKELLEAVGIFKKLLI